MKTNLKLWSAKRILCLALCILMLIGIAVPSTDAFTWAGRESLLGRLFGVTEAFAAEADVATWKTYGTCEWGIDQDGCLWIRPKNGTSGTLTNGFWSNPPWYNSRDSIKSVVVKSGVSTGTGYRMFRDMSNCTTMDLSGLDTSNATSMWDMFRDCSSLTSLDVSNFSTSKVTNMSNMFYRCSSLTSLDVSSFDTSQVTDMSGMFGGCGSLTSLDVSNFNTDNVVNLGGMFNGCSQLTSAGPGQQYDLNISNLNTSNATNMSGMFQNCNALTSLDVSGFDTSKVTTMSYMFEECSSLTSLDASNFNTGNVVNMEFMFSRCRQLKSAGPGQQYDFNISNWNTSNVTNMQGMFAECRSLERLDLSNFDTSNATNMYVMFNNCYKLNEIKLGNTFAFNGNNISSASAKALLPTPPSATTTGKWILQGDADGGSAMTPEEMRDAGTVTAGTWVWDKLPIAILYSNGDFVFQGIYDPIDESRGSVVQTYEGFYDSCFYQKSDVPWYSKCENIFNVYFNNEVQPKYTREWFDGCTNLTAIHGIENLNTSNVKDMRNMFYRCSSLTSLDISGFDTSNVTDMQNMFRECSALTSLDVSEFNTSKLTDTGMRYMFYGCSALTSLDISGFNTSKMADMRDMFRGCYSLNTIKIGDYFAFNGNNISSASAKALLPTPPSATTTGKWILEDDVDGGSAMTPEQMRDAGTVTAGTWVWQEKPTKYTVIYHYNDGTENTNTEKYVAAEAATLSSTYPARFNKIVTSWNTAEDGTGTSYELGATIPANTYAIGDAVDLYAIWEDSTAFTNVSEGVYQFQIPGNAQIKLDGLPAGTVYRVSEMLPNGWILVNQSNSSGSIGPLTNSVSTFINKYMPESASAAIYATKTMDGAPATEDMAFEFTLKEGDNVIQTVTAANGAVLFDPIIYTSAGTHVYTIVENWETYSGPLDASGVTFDTHVETVTVEVSDEGEGKLSAEVTYDADGPAFANRTNPGDLIITKSVIGQTAANADDTFTFTIRIKSPTGGDINSASIEIGKLPTAEQSPEPTP